MLAVILFLVILLAALVCTLCSGAASHKLSAMGLCCYSVTLQADALEEFRACIEKRRSGWMTRRSGRKCLP